MITKGWRDTAQAGRHTPKQVHKRMTRLLFLFLLLLAPCTMQAQTTIKYGTIHYDSLLVGLPQYAQVQQRMKELHKKYESETAYNEQNFKRLFAEFLQGQKDFPQNILMKRQRDLQEQMEKSIAFRKEADALLRAAEADMMKPLREMLDELIRNVGLERGYEMIINLDTPAYPFLHPSVAEDAMPYVKEKIAETVQPGN